MYQTLWFQVKVIQIYYTINAQSKSICILSPCNLKYFHSSLQSHLLHIMHISSVLYLIHYLTYDQHLTHQCWRKKFGMYVRCMMCGCVICNKSKFNAISLMSFLAVQYSATSNFRTYYVVVWVKNNQFLFNYVKYQCFFRMKL